MAADARDWHNESGNTKLEVYAQASGLSVSSRKPWLQGNTKVKGIAYLGDTAIARYITNGIEHCNHQRRREVLMFDLYGLRGA